MKVESSSADGRSTEFDFSIVQHAELVMILLAGGDTTMRRTITGIVLLTMAQPLVAQQPPAIAQVGAPEKAERKICKRSAPSGSLIETRRECHTREEWSRIAQAARATGQDMVDRAGSGGQIPN
jgi:hypothetical protein